MTDQENGEQEAEEVTVENDDDGDEQYVVAQETNQNYKPDTTWQPAFWFTVARSPSRTPSKSLNRELAWNKHILKFQG